MSSGNGEPGKPGAKGTDGGGVGGAGGRGGAQGKQGETGTTGSTGARGKAGAPGVSRRAALVGYGILMVVVAIAIARVETGQKAIQENREFFVEQECQDVNQRHDNSIDELNKAAEAEIAKHPEKAEQIEEEIAPSIAIIDALVPKRNCDEIVELATPEE